jgi:hypothetical protein
MIYNLIVYLTCHELPESSDILGVSEIKLSFKGITESLFSKIIIDKTKCLRTVEAVKGDNQVYKKVYIQVKTT